MASAALKVVRVAPLVAAALATGGCGQVLGVDSYAVPEPGAGPPADAGRSAQALVLPGFPDTDVDTCRQCVADNCRGDVAACHADAACSRMLLCVDDNRCADPNCYARCEVESGGSPIFQWLFDCAFQVNEVVSGTTRRSACVTECNAGDNWRCLLQGYRWDVRPGAISEEITLFNPLQYVTATTTYSGVELGACNDGTAPPGAPGDWNCAATAWHPVDGYGKVSGAVTFDEEKVLVVRNVDPRITAMHERFYPRPLTRSGRFELPVFGSIWTNAKGPSHETTQIVWKRGSSWPRGGTGEERRGTQGTGDPVYAPGREVMSEPLSPGLLIGGRYQLDRLIGQGGMGQVWAATHTVTARRAALKFLRGGPTHNHPEMRRRFLREARAASAVVHPNVVQVHDFFELPDGTPVMVMDLLEGESLAERLGRVHSLELREAVDVLLPVISAVGTAHSLGVVHRDLKPDNVFLVQGTGQTADVRVLDFGIAKLTGSSASATDAGALTATGALLGTPCYMSPEQSASRTSPPWGSWWPAWERRSGRTSGSAARRRIGRRRRRRAACASGPGSAWAPPGSRASSEAGAGGQMKTRDQLAGMQAEKSGEHL